MKTKFFSIMATALLLMVACVEEQILVTSISMDTSILVLTTGETSILTTIVEPYDASNKSIIWKSEDPSIAVVNSKGEVTAIAPGMTTITGTTEDGLFKVKCTVMVDVNPTIVMTTANARDVRIFLAGRGELCIDWGDGTNYDVESALSQFNTYYKEYTHAYTSSSTHTIKITSKEILRLQYVGYQIIDFDVSHATALSSLQLWGNELTSLDLNNNTQLNSLICYDNKLTSLDLSKATMLADLHCENNKLTNLDLNTTELVTLSCNNNELTNLDVRNNAKLTQITCNNNRITSLDLSTNIFLADLFCQNNQITSIEAGKRVVRFDCSFNQLKTLDVRIDSLIQNLYCNNNQLTSLEVADNAPLKYLDCSSNQLTTEALNALFEMLNDRSNLGDKYINIINNPGTDDCDQTIAEKKGWRIIF